MKKIELKVGDWWQIPSEKEVKLRVIMAISTVSKQGLLVYVNAYDMYDNTFRSQGFLRECSPQAFKHWVKAHGAKLIAQTDIETGKVRVVK